MLSRLSHIDKYYDLLDMVSKKYSVRQEGNDIHSITPANGCIGKIVTLVALTHGDEVIGLHIFMDLLLKLLKGKIQLTGQIYLLLANKDAYFADSRFVDTDLNREYANNPSNRLESRRALEIKRIVDGSDYVIDIHQCIEETLTPFFILPYSKESYGWARKVAPNIPIILHRNISTANTLSKYSHAKGKKGVTFEVGSTGVDASQLEIGIDIVKKFIAYPDMKTSSDNIMEYTDTYEIEFIHPYAGEKVEFVKKFANFEDVKQGQLIAIANGIELVSPLTGKILLFPRKWFSQDSKVVPEGIFAIIKEADINLSKS